MMETWISPKARKGAPSEIAGRGLFAVDKISPGEVVAVKGGHIVSTDQLRSMPERLQNSDVQITDDLHLVALSEEEYDAVMLFINHSCEPNVGFGGNVVLVAMRDVDAGEELTVGWRGGTSPPRSRQTGREPLDSSGFLLRLARIRLLSVTRLAKRSSR
jgi:SET domain-containing protein